MSLGNAPVIDVLSKTAAVSAVNWAAPLSKLADLGVDPWDATAQVQRQAVLGTWLQVRSFDDAQALETARLRAATRSAGLSLTDRACLALARTLGVPALTTDRMWNALDLSIEVRHHPLILSALW
jgi:PIN domain nuclease of toxin-antitoxin system